MTELNRRRFLAGTGLLAAGGGLTACGSSFAGGVAGSGPGASTLSYWNLLSGGDGDHMVAMENAYQKAHPEVSLKSVTLTWGNPYYTKVSLATLGNQPPDVAISHLTRATILAQADLLEPLNEAELEPFGLVGKNFTATAWDKAHTNGKLYAIPLDTHPFVLYYNTDVCKKAGLLDSNGKLKDLSGPNGLVDAMRAAKKVTGHYGGVLTVNNDTATQWRFFSTLYWQMGGEVLSDDGTKVVLDEAKAARALDWIANLSGKEKLIPASIDYDGGTTLFSTGQAGFYFQGDWEVSTFITNKTPFSMTSFPNVFGGPYACQADSHSFVLPKDSRRDDEKRKVIFNFIRSMMNNSATWAEGGHIPAWLPFQTSAAYRKIHPQSDYADVAKSAHYDPPAWYSGSGSDFENIVGSAVATVTSGQLSSKKAIAQMRSKLTGYANTPSPV